MESTSIGIEGGEETGGLDSDGDAICLDCDREGEDICLSVSGEEDSKNVQPSDVSNQEEAENELLGQVVYSEKEAYQLFRDYGYQMGFSVRKGKQSYFIGTRNVRTKDYYCSKEGFKIDERPDDSTYNRPSTRTGCRAMIRFTVDKNGEWKVTRSITKHNHELVKPEERHLLRSVRPLITANTCAALNAMMNAGTQKRNAYSDVVDEDCGVENVKTTEKDSCSHGSTLNLMLIDAGDCQSLVSHFKRRAGEEGMFYWDVQIDKEGRMTNFFWRDGRSRIDYDCFGDVVIFDSTRRTNRCNLICAPFVGINHHSQNIIFGCAFLLDDSTTSFIWLLKTFLESMGDRPPKTLITDQNPAMAKAIEEVLPNTQHRLFLWHIWDSATSNLGSLICNKSFQQLFSKCLQGCESEMEFEETWKKMISEYSVEGHKWLNDLYRIRRNWCTTLNKESFDGGINSSQRNVSTNYILSGITDKSNSLTKCILGLEKLVKSWRQNEAKEDFRCNQSSPSCAIKHSDILKHAAKVYTHNLYKLFEQEFLDGCCATTFQEIPCGGSLYKFELTMQGRGSNVWIVHLDMSTMDVSCSCKKFESMGILCSHALRALSLKNVNAIPEKYIIKRWTKDARKNVNKLKFDGSSQQEHIEAELMYHNCIMRYAFDLVLRTQGHEEGRKILWDTLQHAESALETFFDKVCNDAQSGVRNDTRNQTEIDTEEVDVPPMLDPPYVRPEGASSTRLEGDVEKRSKRSSFGEKELKKVKRQGSGKKHDPKVGNHGFSPLLPRSCSILPLPPAYYTSPYFYNVYPAMSMIRNNISLPNCPPPIYDHASQTPSPISSVAWGLGGSSTISPSVPQGIKNTAKNLKQESSSQELKPPSTSI